MKPIYTIKSFLNNCQKWHKENQNINVENCSVNHHSKINDIVLSELSEFVGIIITYNDYQCTEYGADFIVNDNGTIYNIFNLR